MRLDNYLNENIMTDEEMYSRLKEDCSEYLKINKRVSRCLFRGTRKTVTNKFGMFFPRNDRKPKDMPEYVHKELDKEFYKKFGWKVRSEGVFATSDWGESKVYGVPYYFYPSDGFKYVWTKLTYDLYAHYDIATVGFTQRKKVRDITKSITEFYQDDDIETAINMSKEIAFKCHKYYLSTKSFVDFIQGDKDL